MDASRALLRTYGLGEGQERRFAQNTVRTGADGTTPEGVTGAFVFMHATERTDINIPVPGPVGAHSPHWVSANASPNRWTGTLRIMTHRPLQRLTNWGEDGPERSWFHAVNR